MLRKYSLPYKQLLLIPIALLWMFLAWSWEMHSLPSWFPSVRFVPESVLQFGYRCITACIGILLLFFACERYLKDKELPVLQYIGKISLGIYAVHVMFINEIASFFENVLCINSFSIILITFLTSLIITIPIVYVLMKKKYTAQILFGKINK